MTTTPIDPTATATGANATNANATVANATATGGTRRLPAEWEPYGAVLLALPHGETDWAPRLEQVTDTYCRLIDAITSHNMPVVLAVDPRGDVPAPIAANPLVHIVNIPLNDTWARDFGPITCLDTMGTGMKSPLDSNSNNSCTAAVAVDFAFNGWGLKFAADRDNLVTRALHDAGALGINYENRLGTVLEGGSIESDGQGTILTTSRCLLSPNRNGDLDRRGVEAMLARCLGARRVLWLDNGYLEGDDTDSHIDTLARLVAPDAIAYVQSPGDTDPHHEQLQAMEHEIMQLRTAAGEPYRLFPLPMPDPVHDDEGNRLPATYANFLIMPGAVILPTYRQPRHDAEAAQVLARALPGREIVPVDATELIYQHGSIHCVTMQLTPLNV